MWIAPLAVAIALAVLRFIGEEFSEHIERFHIELLSFGAGLIVGTFFLEILPQLEVAETHLSNFVYLSFLGGFLFMFLKNSSINTPLAIVKLQRM